MLGMADLLSVNYGPTWSTTSPGTLTELYDVSNLSPSIGAASLAMATAGATGAGTVSITSSQGNAGILLALRRGPVITGLSASPACAGSTITITGTNLSGATGVTIGGTNVASITSNTATQIIAVIGAGTTGTVQVTSPSGTAISAATFTVNPFPANPGNPTSNSPQCSPLGVTLTRVGTPPVGETWYWQTTPLGTSTTDSGSTFVAATSGTYYLRAQNNTTGCWSAGSGSLAVVINNIPTIATTPSPANAATGVCYAGTGAVTSTSWTAVAGATSYDVYFGAGSLPGTVTANQAGTTYNTGTLLANTTYYWQVVAKNACGDAVGSSTWTFTTSGVPCGYCTPVYSVSCSGSISNVTFNTINNNSACANTTATSYTSYAAIGSPTTTVIRTLSYNLTLTTSASAITSAWIDYNANGVFEASEWVQVFTTGTTGTVSITIPVTATLGTTVMRIRSRAAGNLNGSGDSCTSFASGEAEDYKITIINNTPCTAPTAQPTALTLTPTNAGFNGSFTAASPVPNNYIVVANTTGITPTPTNGTTYSVGGTMGTGNIVTAITPTTTFTTQFLSGSTLYYIYIFSMNDLCIGGPLYLGPSPLSGSGTTLVETYCTPAVTTSTFSTTNYITQVNFIGNFTNSNNGPTTGGATSFGYSNYTGLGPRASQAQGEGVNIFLDTNQANAVFMKAWVDWNKDGVFTDATETVYQCSNAFLNTTFGFQVPTTVSTGDYRIRIRINRATVAGDLSYNVFNACETLANNGETEDYLFTVIADCPAKITSITPGFNCDTGTVTLGAVGTTGTTEYRWYNAATGGSLIGTSASTTWTTPSISTTTTYYVTAYNGACESLFRTAVTATIKPVATLTFSNMTPTVCGENSIIDLSATGNVEQVYLIDENFESGLGVFSNNAIATPNGTITNWQSRTSTYVPLYPTFPVWYPAISSGFGTNRFVMSTSDLVTGGTTAGKVNEALQLTSTVNTTGFLNLNLTFKIYFSSYYDSNNAATEGVFVEFRNGAGPLTAVADVNGTKLTDQGIGTQFITKSINLAPQIGITNLQIRIRYRAGWCDGVAIDDVKLFGDKTLVPNITWTSALPVDAYTNAACTIPYVAGTPVSTVWVKPTLAQLEQGTYSFTANANLTNGCSISGTINVTNQSKIWKGTTSNDWNVASNWLPSTIPDATTCVIIPTGTTSQIMNAPNALAKTVSVKAPTGNLELQSGRNLTVTDNITVEPGATFNVRNSANLIQVNNTTNVGSINMQRNTNIKLFDYVYWSTPVAGFASSAISPTSTFIYKWEPTTTTGYASNFGNWANGSESMTLGRGYIVRAPSTYGTVASNYTATFTGVPNNGNITTPISRSTYTGAPYAGPTTTLVTLNDDNWNLIGNPYPSSISADTFLTDNATKIAGFIRIWTHGTPPISAVDPFYQNYTYNYVSSDYITYNLLGGTVPGFDGYIPAGQGFFTLMRDTAATPNTVSFTNSMRSSAYRNDQFYKTSENNVNALEKHRIWLDLLDSNKTASRILVGYATMATDKFDHLYDAVASGGKSKFELYSLIDTEEVRIQGKSLPFDQGDQIKLGFAASKRDTYTIAIANLDGLFKNKDQKILLEDTEMKMIHDLTLSPYEFSADMGRFNDRFILKYSKKETTETNVSTASNLNVYTTTTVNVKSTDFNIKNVEVFDIQGKKLVSVENVYKKELEIAQLRPTLGALLVRVTLENGEVQTKKIIY